MAVDSSLKRFTMMSLAGEGAGLPPMKTFTTTPGGPAFRAQQLWLYNGVSLEDEEEAASGTTGQARLSSLRLRLGL